MRILLDTCTFLWITLDDSLLSSQARERFLDPENEVFLSAASAWEISIKYTLGRLPLPEPPDRFVPDQRRRHGIHPLALDEEATLREHHLPKLHKDPFDRILICQALAYGLIILTPDPLIRQYPVVQVDW